VPAGRGKVIGVTSEEFAMKLMMPLMLTAPTLIQGGLAMHATRVHNDVRTQ
jgi:hypothetical protein